MRETWLVRMIDTLYGMGRGRAASLFLWHMRCIHPSIHASWSGQTTHTHTHAHTRTHTSGQPGHCIRPSKHPSTVGTRHPLCTETNDMSNQARQQARQQANKPVGATDRQTDRQTGRQGGRQSGGVATVVGQPLRCMNELANNSIRTTPLAPSRHPSLEYISLSVRQSLSPSYVPRVC